MRHVRDDSQPPLEAQDFITNEENMKLAPAFKELIQESRTFHGSRGGMFQHVPKTTHAVIQSKSAGSRSPR